MRSCQVFAPGCIGNIGPGLDILGLALTGPGDTVRAELCDGAGVRILEPGHPDLSSEPAQHTSGIAARAVLDRAHRSSTGIALTIHKGLPLAGGQGGSAASAVASAVAVNLLLDSPLDQQALLECCLRAEETVAGRHLDNIAPCLLGGIVLVRSMNPIDVVRVPAPPGLIIVLAVPSQRLETRRGRAVLPTDVSRETALAQAAQVAAMVAAFSSGDLALLGRSVEDHIAEPARAPLLPGFLEAKAAALGAGALGCSISGSGPAAFAFAADLSTAERVAAAMRRGYEHAGVDSETRLAQVDIIGARVISSPGAGSETVPSERSVLVCLACGQRYPELFSGSRCACGGLLEVWHPAPLLRGGDLQREWARRRGSLDSDMQSGVWRFRELVLPGAERPVTQPEGNTPLIQRDPIAAWCGSDWLALKHEGHNPTGSFKDRGMTVGVTQAQRVGAKAVACASTGNTSASLAAYAAQAGIPALVLVPSGQVAMGKLSQSLAYGARTLLVRGDFDDCLRLIQEAEAKIGVYLLNSINPFRIEGQKTIVFELLEQLGWDPPDWIVVPAGNLGNTAAFGKALREAFQFGLISKIPRLAAVQAQGAAPFYQSFLEGFTTPRRVKAETIASAIRIGNPASYDRAVRSIRETSGVVAAVSDEAILEAKAVIDAAGVGCEPASAASVAGLKQLIGSGVIRKNERVVAILTGHVLKDPDTLMRYHQEGVPPPAHANRPLEIEANVGALERAVGQSKGTG
ncbi:MAG: threonine synthase [Gemmatimonadota bacterium]